MESVEVLAVLRDRVDEQVKRGAVGIVPDVLLEWLDELEGLAMHDDTLPFRTFPNEIHRRRTL